jgi:general secretion pathway protein M
MIDASNLPRGLPGRILALALTLATAAALYLSVAAPFLGFYADRASLLSTRELLRDKIVAAAAQLPQLRVQASELSATSDAQRATLPGSSDPIAMANLQNRVGELATSAGATISSTETVPPEIRDYYRRIGLRIVLNGSFESLIAFISGLEASTTPLVVDNLQIHNIQSRAGSSQTARLDAAVDVYGFRLNEPSSTPRP